ncbi:HepT-like ribonuclease domain-containing protein [Geodermatophilus telluris]|uniref:HepT-like ribonuclease domain-containing protein n=1 Tax=Geodermatophilus telluris TaxID=1190417 RepID=UPI000B8541A6|nr:HepT-like ribonuclease domain-containing protein [Geodermatophilus telluris]
MSATELVVELVKALAWPLAVVVLVLLLRPFIADRLTDFEAFGVRAQFRELTEEAQRSAEQAAETSTGQGSEPSPDAITSVDEDLYVAAERDPTKAIIAAYERVVDKVRERLAAAGLRAPESNSGLQLARIGHDSGVIDASTAEAIRSMAELRNRVVHGRKEIRSAEAIDYLTAADNVLYSLSRDAGRSTTRFTVTEDGRVLGRHMTASAAFRLVADRVARDVGIDRILAVVGPPRLGRSRDALTRPQRAHKVAPDLELWHTTQLNQRDYRDMVAAIAPLSEHRIEMAPDDLG